MGLLQTIKSLLGLDGTRSATSDGTSGEQDVDVTVEREPSTESEDAVKGTETASASPETDVLDAEEEQAGDDEAAEEAVEAESSSASAADAEAHPEASDAVEADAVEAEPDEESDADAESAEEPEAEAEPVDAAEAEAEPAAESEPADEPEREFAGADDPVTEIKGIGPAYADRLSGLDIETVGDLAVADAADIAARTDLAETRVAGWIERANDY